MSDFALRAKNFLLLHRTAVLSTLSASHRDYPFGSIAPYDIDRENNLSIFVSRISEHYKNLKKDSRASLLVAESFSEDPQAEARATALVRLEEISSTELPEVEQQYFKRFPEAPGRALAHDFAFFRGAIERLRWIGGFGEIRWISAEELLKTEFDEVAYEGASVLEHMNSDHEPALRDILKAEKGPLDEGSVVKMTAIDRRGFSVRSQKGGKKRLIEISFPQAIGGPGEVRQAMIALVEKSRQKL